MKLMVLDGNSIVNRAFYGVHMLTTRDGTPTNAVYGFLTILQKLRDEEKPDALCVCFDLKAPTFRHLQYEGYKAQRKGMPDELAAQMPILKEVLDAMNIPRYELEGWEADDLIGTIAARDTAAGWDTVVVTGDKDSLQLVTDKTHVKLVTTRMGQTTTKEMTPESFREEYGFDPIHIVDLKALMGDASDNIPGVKGVGEKTAMGLIQMYGSIARLYDHMPDVVTAPETPAKPAMVKKLVEGRDMAQMSYELATIRCDAPLDFKPEDALIKAVDQGVLYDLFLKLEFAKLIDKMGLKGGQGITQSAAGQVDLSARGALLGDSAQIPALLERWEKAGRVCVLALSGLSAVAVLEGGAVTVAVADQLPDYGKLLSGLFSAKIKKVGHEVKDLMNTLLGEGLSTDGFVFDTALAAYLLAPTDGSYALDKLAISYFNTELPPQKAFTDPDAFGPLADQTGAVNALSAYCAMVGALCDTLSPKLEELGMHELYYGVELPLCPVLAGMEQSGFLVDRKALTAFGEMLSARIAEAETKIFECAGEKFNINSTQQLGHILFEQLGLPPVKKTKTGYSTDAAVLETLADSHPIVPLVTEYRFLAKVKSTFLDGLLGLMQPDGRVHTSFNQNVAATGRISSTEPNMQNIPVRTQQGREIRKAFIASKGNVLVDADYSQIELRL
ncbi:MAG: DNA polymerase I, partial [Clostridia bacterium]|nr:DNA polymerase I [Clostridia bacterium]